MFTLRDALQVMRGEKVRVSYYGNTPYEKVTDKEERVPVEWLDKRVTHIGFQPRYEMIEVSISDEDDNTESNRLRLPLRMYSFYGAIDSNGPFKVRSILDDYLFADSFTATKREIIISDGTRNYCTGIRFDASKQVSTKNLHFMETIEKMLNQAKKRGIEVVYLDVANEDELKKKNPWISEA